jgi:hypothetical protein
MHNKSARCFKVGELEAPEDGDGNGGHGPRVGQEVERERRLRSFQLEDTFSIKQ